MQVLSVLSVKYYLWENVTVERKDKPDTTTTQKNQKNGSIKSVIKHLASTSSTTSNWPRKTYEKVKF